MDSNVELWDITYLMLNSLAREHVASAQGLHADIDCTLQLNAERRPPLLPCQDWPKIAQFPRFVPGWLRSCQYIRFQISHSMVGSTLLDLFP
jgi:hypothetical protein